MSELVTQVKALEGMDVAQLREKYRDVFGEDAISRNRKVLIERIKRRLHENDMRAQREQQQPGGAKPAGDIITRVHELRHMSLEDLRAEHSKVFGTPSKSRSRKALFVKIAKRVQEDALRSKPEGAVPAPTGPTIVARFERKPKTRSRNATKAAGKKESGAKTGKKTRVKAIGERDSRIPRPGVVISKSYKGKALHLKVLDSGFELNGKPYRSLSAAAKAVTGAIWNGFLFWGLIPRENKKEKAGK